MSIAVRSALLTAAVLAALAAPPAAASEPALPAGVVWSAAVAGGLSHGIAHSLEDRKVVGLAAGVEWRGPAVGLGLELVPLFLLSGGGAESTHAPGFNLLVRTDLASAGSTRLALELGAGMLR